MTGTIVSGGGPSFFVGLLPYLDFAPAYNMVDFNSQFDTRVQFSAQQQAFFAATLVPTLNCPSSELKKRSVGRTCGTDPALTQRPHYVGVSGAVISPVDGTTYYVSNTGYGYYVDNGALPPGVCVPISDITDGTSNTMMMSEQGRPWNDVTQTDNRSCQHCGGAWEGCYYVGGHTVGSQFCQNLVTILYAPNNMSTGLTAADTPYMSSNPLSSRHVGGVHILKADGTVVFISDNINFRTLLALAQKNDNQTIGEY